MTLAAKIFSITQIILLMWTYDQNFVIAFIWEKLLQQQYGWHFASPSTYPENGKG